MYYYRRVYNIETTTVAAAIVPLNRIKRSLIYVASITAAHYSRLVKSVDNTHTHAHTRSRVYTLRTCVLCVLCVSCVCVRLGQKRPGNNEISANVRGTGKLRRYVVGGGGICSMARDHVVFHRPSAGVMRFIIHTHIYTKRNVLRYGSTTTTAAAALDRII